MEKDKKRSLRLCSVLSGTIFFSYPIQAEEPQFHPTQVLVRFQDTTVAASKDAAHAAVQATVLRNYSIVSGLQFVRVPEWQRLMQSQPTRANCASPTKGLDSYGNIKATNCSLSIKSISPLASTSNTGQSPVAVDPKQF